MMRKLDPFRGSVEVQHACLKSTKHTAFLENAGHKINRLLWNWKIRYQVKKNLALSQF
jgi:hypothetical protein